MIENMEHARQALLYVSADGDWRSWTRILTALKTAFGDDARDIAEEWSQTGASYRPRDFSSAWRGCQPGAVDIATLAYEAKAGGWPGTGGAIDRNKIKDMQEKAKINRKIQEEKKAMTADAAAKMAQNIFELDGVPYVGQIHAYAQKKGLKNPNIRIQDDAILIPVTDIDGRIMSLQRIYPDGSRYFLEGTKTEGGLFLIDGADDTIIIYEGYSKSEKANRLTGHLTFCAFSCHQLEKVAVSVRERYRASEIIIISDTEDVGRRCARAAAASIDAKIAMPPDGLDLDDMADDDALRVIRDAQHVVTINRPPGVLGDITRWIASQGYYPRDNLAMACACSAVSALSYRYRSDDQHSTAPNIMILGVADSSTGKESIINSARKLIINAGIGRTMSGGITSSKELLVNFVRHQVSSYIIDEVGEMLHAISQSRDGKGNAYMSQVIGYLMDLYSKSSGGLMQLRTKERDEYLSAIKNQISQLKKAQEENELRPGQDILLEKLDLMHERVEKDNSIVSPYLVFFGTTTPASLQTSITENSAENGFLARMIITSDAEANPRPSVIFYKREPEFMQRLRDIVGRVSADRIDADGQYVKVRDTPQARKKLKDFEKYQYTVADNELQTGGATPLARRMAEMAGKLSLIAAIADGEERRIEHVEWAIMAAIEDFRTKSAMIKFVASQEKNSGYDLTKAREKQITEWARAEKNGIYISQIVQKLRRGKSGISEEATLKILDKIRKDGAISISGKRVYAQNRRGKREEKNDKSRRMEIHGE